MWNFQIKNANTCDFQIEIESEWGRVSNDIQSVHDDSSTTEHTQTHTFLRRFVKHCDFYRFSMVFFCTFCFLDLSFLPWNEFLWETQRPQRHHRCQKRTNHQQLNDTSVMVEIRINCRLFANASVHKVIIIINISLLIEQSVFDGIYGDNIVVVLSWSLGLSAFSSSVPFLVSSMFAASAQFTCRPKCVRVWTLRQNIICVCVFRRPHMHGNEKASHTQIVIN